MAGSERFRALADAQAAATGKVTDTLQKAVYKIWEGFTDWYDDAAVYDRVQKSVTLVEAAQGQTRKQAESYLRSVFKLLDLDSPFVPDFGMLEYPRHGVAPETVWERPAILNRYLISTGMSPTEAMQQVLSRVQEMAVKEVQLAQREHSGQVMSMTAGVVGYRRIVHPERSRTGVCGLCLVAADRIYQSDELMPLHDNCKCTVLPVTTDHDPGLKLNAEDLNRLYTAGGSTYASDLSAIRVQTYTSGELGPILTRGGTAIGEGEARRKLAPRESANQASGTAADRARMPKRLSERLEDYGIREIRFTKQIEEWTGKPEYEAQLQRARRNLDKLNAERDRLKKSYARYFEEAS